jgi:hypothetical protein
VRQPSEYAAAHRAADYFERLLRAKVVKALKSLRRRGVSVTRADIQKALKPAVHVIKDAVRAGGRIGATRVKETVK